MNLLLIVSFIQGVSMAQRVQFDWQTASTTRWAKGCQFLDGDFKVKNSTARDCGPLCVTYLDCTHFNWVPDSSSNGLCHLKSGQVTGDAAMLSVQAEAVCGYLADRVWNNLGVIIGGSTGALVLISAIVALILAKVKRWCCFKQQVTRSPLPEPSVNNYQKFREQQVVEDPVYEEIPITPAVHLAPRPPAVIPTLPLIGLI